MWMTVMYGYMRYTYNINDMYLKYRKDFISTRIYITHKEKKGEQHNNIWVQLK